MWRNYEDPRLTRIYTCCIKRAVGVRDYEGALRHAREEYTRLLDQREELDLRLARLRQAIASLAAICGEAVGQESPGLTEACRSVLKAAQAPLPATALRDRIAALGLDLSTYSNPLASIHVVLRRLVYAGEARLVPRRGGAPAFAWRPRVRSVVITERQAAALRRGDRRMLRRLEKPKS